MNVPRTRHIPSSTSLRLPPLATEQELSDFLKGVEKRAFKRALYHVRDEEAALDIVQDSMMKLSEHYGDKPVELRRGLYDTTQHFYRNELN